MGKKEKMFFMLSIIALMVIGCCPNPYPTLHSGKKPDDYGPAKWVCGEPDIWFQVLDEASLKKKWYAKVVGEINFGDEVYPVSVLFTDAETVLFQTYRGEYYDDNKESLIVGQGIFTPDTLIVKVSGREGVFFRGETLEFKKEEE